MIVGTNNKIYFTPNPGFKNIRHNINFLFNNKINVD